MTRTIALAHKLATGLLIAGCLLPLLYACAPDFEPPPGYQGGFLWNSDKSRTVTVEPGDTLYSVSQRYDVPIRAIVARNALRQPYTLTAGQELVLDPTRRHAVAAGETLNSVAAQYGVEPSMVAEANDLHAPYTLKAGQQLWIPDPFTIAAATPVSASAVPTAGASPAQMASNAPLVSGAAANRSSVIAVENLAPPPGTPTTPDFGVPAQPNAVQPNTAPPAAPTPMTAPPGGSTAPAAPPAVNPQTPSLELPQAVPPQAPSAQPTTPTMPTPTAPPPIAPPAGPSAAAQEQVASLPPAETVAPAATKFIWPVKGRLVTGFGPAGKGLHNDGINIAAPLGTQVRAVDNGVVAYAGSELKGFGNLLLIKHANGITTAYAHNQKLLVTKGDVVKQGQVVATVGKTGNVDSPQLHFEVRVGTQAVDPEEYLRQASH